MATGVKFITTIFNQHHIADTDDIEIFFPKVLHSDFRFDLIQPRPYQLVIWDCILTERFTAEGVAKWIEFFRDNDPQTQYIFKNIPKRLVDIMNRTQGFLPENCRFTSFEWPMECESCDHAENELVFRGKDFLESSSQDMPELLKLPMQLNCPNCQGMMEPAVDMKSYLKFLKKKNAISK